ncbi:MAG TPA: hypothetical protein VGQ83_11375 [Polyangia bacterium]|jgi:hypothetical protein
MATTYDTIRGFLDGPGCSYQFDEEQQVLVTGFKTEHYVNQDGEKGLPVIIKLEENGEFLKVFSPAIYHVESGQRQLGVFLALLHICWRTKMLQYEYDPADGEVRAMIEFPLEDAELTERQFMRIVFSLVELVDRYDPIIRRAMATGEVDFHELAPDLGEQLASLFRTMAESGGGIDELRRMIEESRAGQARTREKN